VIFVALRSSTKIQSSSPHYSEALGRRQVGFCDAAEALTANGSPIRLYTTWYDFVACSIPNMQNMQSMHSVSIQQLSSSPHTTNDAGKQVVSMAHQCRWCRGITRVGSSVVNPFQAALQWSMHMNLPAVLVPPLPTLTNHAAAICSSSTRPRW
jgi:hypothetical protein